MTFFYFQILQNFSLKSMNKDEVGMRIEMVPVPDQKITIDFDDLESV